MVHNINVWVFFHIQGPVFTVVCYKGYLFSGGRDGILHCWHFTKNMDATGFLQVYVWCVVSLAVNSVPYCI